MLIQKQWNKTYINNLFTYNAFWLFSSLLYLHIQQLWYISYHQSLRYNQRPEPSDWGLRPRGGRGGFWGVWGGRTFCRFNLLQYSKHIYRPNGVAFTVKIVKILKIKKSPNCKECTLSVETLQSVFLGSADCSAQHSWVLWSYNLTWLWLHWYATLAASDVASCGW